MLHRIYLQAKNLSVSNEPVILQPIVQSMTVQPAKPIELVNHTTARIVNLSEISLFVDEMVTFTNPSIIGGAIKRHKFCCW